MSETTPNTLIQPRKQPKLDELEEEIKALEAAAKGEQEKEEEVQEEPPKKKEEPEEKGLSGEEATFKKRYGDLRRHQQKREQELLAEIENLKNAKPEELPVTKDQVERWVKKYPDIAGIVRSLAGEEAQTRFSEVDRRTKELEEMRQAIAYEKAVSEVEKVHPDFHQVSESDDFHSWASEQSDSLQRVIYDELDPKGLIQVLRLYKSEKGIKDKKPKQDNSAALSVKTRSGQSAPTGQEATKWSESKVAKLSNAEFTKYEEEILKAMSEGNFSYDMSKSR